MIRALIVDDEPLARRGIRVRLENEPDVEIVGEAEDGFAAIELIRAHRPDLVFLDVQMPGLDGFETLERVAAEHLPMVIFVTAHDAFALRAFEVHATDYLLKPFTEPRFAEALRRARVELSHELESPERGRLGELLAALEAARNAAAAAGPAPGGTAGTGGAASYPQRFSVRERDRILLVRVDSLEAVQAAGNYVELVGAGRKHLLRETLSEMERKLDPNRFVRIHRSTIVNADRIREILPDPHGDGDVVMESGAVHRLSRAYRERLLPRGETGNA